jgi:hypothetical protein
MWIADAAWHDVDTTTICNCWHKAGILPEMDSTPLQPSIPITSLLNDPSESQANPVTHAEQQVEAALNDLVATGALQTKNRMDVESLLNPAGESQILMEASDKEIYQAVINSIAACGNIKINGGDNVDEDIPIKPHPTCCDVLKAVSTINSYINDMNNPVACKFETILSSFSRQLCLEATKSLKETVLTDFFQKL